nr:DNA-packaging protein [uncultured Anaerotignum sp.]
MDFLTAMKNALRITHDKLDEEIRFNIDVCKKDLNRVGIVRIDDTDPIIRKVTELYLKWQYDFMGEGERYEKAYKGMRNGLSLCGEYNV